MAKLLVVAHDLPPIVSPQSIQIGRLLNYLPEDFHQYVVTSDDKTWRKDTKFYRDIHKKFIDIIVIRHNFLLRILRLIFRKVPDVFLCWHMLAYNKIINTWGKEHFDGIVTFSYPMSSSLLGLCLKRHFKTKWISFFSDPWVDNPHFHYKGIIKWINAYLERKVIKNADINVFASPEIQNAYIRKYPFIADNAAFLEHSYDPDLYETLQSQDKSITNKNNPLLSPFIKGEYGKISTTENKHLSCEDTSSEKRNKLILRYIGTFYGERTIEPFLIALRKLLDTKDLRETMLSMEVIGNISRKYINQYASLLKKYDLDTIVKFKPPVSYLESLRLMQTSNVLVLIDAPIDGSVYLPSKLIDYIGSGQPILAITPQNGASARVIRKVGGWLAEPDNVDEIVKILREILDAYKNDNLFHYKPSEEIAKEYSISISMKKLVGILSGNTLK